MTKKDYIKFATLLKNLRTNIYKNNEEEYNFTLNFNDVYDGLVEIFKLDNHRFDETRFKNFIRNK